jgi:hypothetical protein
MKTPSGERRQTMMGTVEPATSITPIKSSSLDPERGGPTPPWESSASEAANAAAAIATSSSTVGLGQAAKRRSTVEVHDVTSLRGYLRRRCRKSP